MCIRDRVEAKVNDGVLKIENRKKAKLFGNNKRVGITITMPKLESCLLYTSSGGHARFALRFGAGAGEGFCCLARGCCCTSFYGSLPRGPIL